MLNTQDKENLVKSSQTADLLVQDLRDLVKSANPLLSEIALEILQQAVQIEQRLSRIVTITDRKALLKKFRAAFSEPVPDKAFAGKSDEALMKIATKEIKDTRAAKKSKK